MTDDVAKDLQLLMALVRPLLDKLYDQELAEALSKPGEVKRRKLLTRGDWALVVMGAIIILLVYRSFIYTPTHVLVPDKIIWQDPYTKHPLVCPLVKTDPPTYGQCGGSNG
jgi:hypothetical protein